MSEHSNLPWSLGGRRPYIAAKYGDGKFITYGALDKSQGCHDWPFISRGETEANGKIIVKAVNNHQKLVDALEELVTILDSIYEGSDYKVDSFTCQPARILLDEVNQ